MNVYLDEGGSRIFTSSGISGGQYWFTGYQKHKGGSIRRLMSNDLPVRSKQADAQADLDAYASRFGWKIETLKGIKEDTKKYEEPEKNQVTNLDGITWRSGV